MVAMAMVAAAMVVAAMVVAASKQTRRDQALKPDAQNKHQRTDQS